MPLNSMTGYGKGEVSLENITVSVEIKSVNHRYADISVKLPRTFMSLESAIKKRVDAALGRGKIDIYVNYELTNDAQARPSINQQLAATYHQLFIDLAAQYDLQGGVSLDQIISQQDVIQVEEAVLEEKHLEACLQEAAGKALEQLMLMRRAEGQETYRDMEERLVVSEKILSGMEARAPQVPLEWQERLTERLERLQQNVEWDPQRVAQEIAVFTDRCDISEEITRFKSHLIQFRELFDSDEPVGRRMDFLVQELNREVNTMGSKSNDAELTSSVVALKSELEKIREQVQNIE